MITSGGKQCCHHSTQCQISEEKTSVFIVLLIYVYFMFVGGLKIQLEEHHR